MVANNVATPTSRPMTHSWMLWTMVGRSLTARTVGSAAEAGAATVRMTTVAAVTPAVRYNTLRRFMMEHLPPRARGDHRDGCAPGAGAGPWERTPLSLE